MSSDESEGANPRTEGERHFECRNCGRRITVWGKPVSNCLNCRSMDWMEVEYDE